MSNTNQSKEEGSFSGGANAELLREMVEACEEGLAAKTQAEDDKAFTRLGVALDRAKEWLARAALSSQSEAR